MDNRFKPPEIQASEAAIVALIATHQDLLRQMQATCTHPRIVYNEGSQQDRRLCLCCGLEEYSPAYHTFRFKQLSDIEFAKRADSIVEYRYPYADIPVIAER